MPGKNDSQSDPHVQDKNNDPAPAKGTEEPWKRPGQKSQNPNEPDAPKPDLDRWNRSIKGR
jgi:hypothetical protein